MISIFGIQNLSILRLSLWTSQVYLKNSAFLVEIFAEVLNFIVFYYLGQLSYFLLFSNLLEVSNCKKGVLWKDHGLKQVEKPTQ